MKLGHRLSRWFNGIWTDKVDRIKLNYQYRAIEFVSTIPNDQWSIYIGNGSETPIFQTTSPKGVPVVLQRRRHYTSSNDVYLYIYLKIDGIEYKAGDTSLFCPIMALYERLYQHEPFQKQIQMCRGAEKGAKELANNIRIQEVEAKANAFIESL